MLRVKNEARWIDRVIRAVQPATDSILVLDDHSSDGTPEICESLGCQVFRSEFDSLDEAHDKDFLLEKLWAAGAEVGDYCIMRSTAMRSWKPRESLRSKLLSHPG